MYIGDRRDCCTVISQMLNRIPDSKVDFKKDLMKNFEDAKYKPVEDIIQWYGISVTLEKYLPILVEDWEYEVTSIYTTVAIEDLKIKI